MFNALKSGDTIGVISPAYIPDKDRLENGINYLVQKGFKIKRGKSIEARHGYFAGTDSSRLEDIEWMFKDSEVKAIMCSRGGWGALRLIDKLDYELIRKNPKPLIGYSDITTLQLAIWTKSKVPSFSGPMVAVEMGKGIMPFTEEHFWGQLTNTRPEYDIDFSDTPARVLNQGRAEGRIIGGCLSLVAAQLGTPYSPNYEGAILFLEDVGEKPYKIDRYLAQLKQAEIFNKIHALVLGDFLDCEAEQGEISFRIEEIIEDYFKNLHIPIVTNFPYGHGDVKFTMPIGVQSKIDTNEKLLKFSNPFIRHSEN